MVCRLTNAETGANSASKSQDITPKERHTNGPMISQDVYGVQVRPSMIPEKGETPVTKSQTVTPKQDAGRRGSSAASASPVAVGGFDDAVELKKKLVDAQADLEWQQETVRDLESALTAKEEELEKVNEVCDL